jgi:hypothetical protein
MVNFYCILVTKQLLLISVSWLSFFSFDSLFSLFFLLSLVLRLRIHAILTICISVSDLGAIQCGVSELGALGDAWEFQFVGGWNMVKINLWLKQWCGRHYRWPTHGLDWCSKLPFVLGVLFFVSNFAYVLHLSWLCCGANMDRCEIWKVLLN